MVDFVFIGHSHYQFCHVNQCGKLVNVGSVGQNRLEGGVACWAILDTFTREVQLKSTIYNTEPLLDEILEIDPIYLKDVLKRKLQIL